MSDTTTEPKSPQLLDRVVIRFAGDSGDGMQLAGDRFTTTSALLGNDLATFPDFPAEIRAPAGTLAGVSAFQVHISDHDISTPGDSPNVLVAMNPAALKANIDALPKGATVIVNVDAFEERNLAKANYPANPLADGSLSAYTVYEVPMTSITAEVCKEAGVKPRDAERSKNFFALGLISWLYTRPIEPDPDLDQREVRGQAAGAGGQSPGVQGRLPLRRDRRAVRVRPTRSSRPSSNRASTSTSPATRPPPGGSSPPSDRSGLPLFLGTYPITPASDILHELSKHKQFGVRTFQAEDEISGIGAALGRRLRRRPRGHHHLGPGHRSQVGDHGIGHQPRAAPPDHRHPARGTIHRASHQDRTGRPAPRHVRASRGGTAAHRGRQDAVALFRGGDRGGPAGRQVPHAGHPAVGRLPGQRLRAVAPARPRPASRPSNRPSPPPPTTPIPTAPRSSGPTSATRTPWPGPGRRPGWPVSSTASAAWRRPTARATSPTTAPTTSG